MVHFRSHSITVTDQYTAPCCDLCTLHTTLLMGTAGPLSQPFTHTQQTRALALNTLAGRKDMENASTAIHATQSHTCLFNYSIVKTTTGRAKTTQLTAQPQSDVVMATTQPPPYTKPHPLQQLATCIKAPTSQQHQHRLQLLERVK